MKITHFSRSRHFSKQRQDFFLKTKTKSLKLLSVTFDEHFTFNEHVNNSLAVRRSTIYITSGRR